jgi:hypothetical protein
MDIKSMRSSLFAFFYFLMAVSDAQYSTSLLINPLGFTSTYLVASPLLLSYQNNCIHFNTGLPVLLGASTSKSFIYPCQPASSFTPLKLIVYPNPTQQTATLKATIGDHLDQPVWVHIYTSAGQLIKRWQITCQLLQVGFQMDLTGFSAGIYFIHVQSEWVNGTLQLIKL